MESRLFSGICEDRKQAGMSLRGEREEWVAWITVMWAQDHQKKWDWRRVEMMKRIGGGEDLGD